MLPAEPEAVHLMEHTTGFLFIGIGINTNTLCLLLVSEALSILT